MCDCNKWMPIETAPRDGTRILTLHAPSDEVTELFWDAVYGEWVDGIPTMGIGSYEPTHWIRKPAPPQASGEA